MTYCFSPNSALCPSKWRLVTRLLGLPQFSQLPVRELLRGAVSVFRWSLLADRLDLGAVSRLLAFRAVQELLRGAGLGVQVVVAGGPT